jgi:hypothetical protein
LFTSSGKSNKKRGGRTIAELVRASLRGNNLEESGPKEKAESSTEEESAAEEPDDDYDVDFPVSPAVQKAIDLDYFLINKYEKVRLMPFIF